MGGMFPKPSSQEDAQSPVLFIAGSISFNHQPRTPLLSAFPAARGGCRCTEASPEPSATCPLCVTAVAFPPPVHARGSLPSHSCPALPCWPLGKAQAVRNSGAVRLGSSLHEESLEQRVRARGSKPPPPRGVPPAGGVQGAPEAPLRGKAVPGGADSGLFSTTPVVSGTRTRLAAAVPGLSWGDHLG